MHYLNRICKALDNFKNEEVYFPRRQHFHFNPRRLLILLGFLSTASIHNLTAQNTLAEKLGYGPDDKLLIIHADDLGVSHSQNLGSFLAMKVGMVNSGSIMMPCPWVPEVAAFAKEYPQADLGLHLTLTSEWKHIKWGPVASKDKVPSLVNEQGYFYDNCLEFSKKATAAEMEIELKAQIEQAFKMGIQPTHLDSHMGCLVFTAPEFFEVYLRLGRAYKIPVLISRFFMQAAPQSYKDLIQPEDLIIEKTYTAVPSDYAGGMNIYYEKVLTNLSSGIQTILIHPALDNAELQAMAIDHPDWGADWRQADFDFFTSAKCKELIAQENIKLITWGEIQKVWYSK